MPSTFADAKKEAEKILGKDAQIPKEKFDLSKHKKEADTAFKDYDKSRETLEKALLDLDNVWSAAKNTAKQNSAIFETAKFGLDEKKKDDLKKITDARAVFSEYYKEYMADCDKQTDRIDELEKHLVQLGAYKGSKSK